MREFFRKKDEPVPSDRFVETPPEWHAKNLFKLDASEQDILQTRVEAAGGTARIIVHPFFEAYHHPWFHAWKRYHRANPEIRKIEEEVERVLLSDLSTSPPLIVFEETERVLDTEERIRRGSGGGVAAPQNGDIYVVPTIEESPTPDLYHENIPKKFSRYDRAMVKKSRKAYKDSWRKFAETLEGLGVKKALINGMYFHVLRAWDDKALVAKGSPKEIGYARLRNGRVSRNLDDYLKGCVATVMKKLQRAGIAVELSGTTFPHGAEEFNGIKNKLAPHENNPDFPQHLERV